MIHALLHAPARFPRRTLAIALLAALAAGVCCLRLRQDTSLASLFPSDQPAPAAMIRVLDDFPSAEEMLVLASTPDSQLAQPGKLIGFARRLESAIAADAAAAKLVSGVHFQVDTQSKRFISSVVGPNAVFYLDDADFAAARRRLTKTEMVQQLQRDQQMLAAPGPAAGALAAALMQDPLRLHEFLAGRLAGMAPVPTFGGSDAFLSPDGRSLLIRISGVRPPGDLAFCRAITDAVTAAARRVNSDGLALEFSGAYPIAAQSERALRHDSISSVIGSICFLALLFAIVFRRPIPLFLVTFAPVALGVLYGFGLFALIRPKVTPLTAVIGAMLAGVGIDYCIFYLVNFQDRRRADDDSVAAARRTIDAIGSPLVAAWVTSVVGFVAVGFSTVAALRDFSLLGSLCLALVLLCAVTVLPALLVLLDRVGSPTRVSIAPLLRWIDRHARWCLAIGIGAAVMAGVELSVMGPRLELDSDPTLLHPQPNPPLDAEADIGRRMGFSPDSLMVYLHADSPGQLLVLAHRVRERLSTSAAKRAGVRGTFGLATLLPDPRLEARRLAEVGPAYAARVLGDFDSAVAASPFAPRAFAGYRSFLRTLLTPSAEPGVADLLEYPQLAQSVLPLQAFAGQPATEGLTLLFLDSSVATSSQRQAAVEQLRGLLSDLPGATLTGMAVLSLDTQSTVQRNLPRLIGVALAMCAMYLLLHFRSVLDTLLAVVPTALSLLCLLAIARASGVRMNLVNIISVPLLVGIDIDYGIFLVSVRRRCRSRAELLERVMPAALAVMVCAGATLLGFGSLAFTSVPAVRSLGWAVAIGVGSCAAGAWFVLLPLLLWMADRRASRRGNMLGQSF